MADKKISQLTSAAPAIGTDELPINRAGTSGKLTITEITAIEKAERVSADGALPSLTTTNKSNLVAAINEVNSSIAGKMPLSYLDIDPLLAANSDARVSSQKAIKSYITSVLPGDATETVKGIAEIATQVETDAGIDDTRFVTPLKLKVNLASKNYLQGLLTGNTLPLYNSIGGVLEDSAIRQTSTGSRILLNGISDDLSSGLQVDGSIRQTTITNKITAFDANGVLVSGGSGTSGNLPIWNAVNGLTNSSFIQNSGSAAIGTVIDADSKFYVPTTDTTIGIRSVNSHTGILSNSYGISASSIGAKSTANIGVYGLANSSTSTNIGIEGKSSGATSPINIGGKFTASQGTANYALQLTDGTETVAGRFLKNITTDGKAQWANITAADISGGVVGGSGTTNFLARWTSSTALGIGTLIDDGNRIGIGTSPNLYSHVYGIQNSYSTGINIINNKPSGGATAIVSGVAGACNGGGSLITAGIVGASTSVSPIGIRLGGLFTASGGAQNYSVQLQDGTEDTNKFLRSIDSTGNANWETITSEIIWGTTWHVPSYADFDTLRSFVGNNGGSIKEVGLTHWGSPNIGATDLYNFSARQNDGRDSTGFTTSNGTFWTAGSTQIFYVTKSSDSFNTAAPNPTFGFGIRLVRNATKAELALPDGTNTITSPGSLKKYIGNDNTLYHTVKIGTQIWLKENLREVYYTDGTAIPYAGNDITWGTLAPTGAYCFLNNLTTNGPIYGALYSYAVAISNNLVNTLQIQLNTGSATSGKVLECFNNDGVANWGKVTSDYTTGESVGPIRITVAGYGYYDLTFTNGLLTLVGSAYY